MLPLADVRDFIAELKISADDHTYMGRLDNKKECSIGIYDSKRNSNFNMALGGNSNKSYDVKRVTLLVHWNKSLRETEKKAYELVEALSGVEDAAINTSTICFIFPTEPIPVDSDSSGVYEMVVDADIYYKTEKGR